MLAKSTSTLASDSCRGYPSIHRAIAMTSCLVYRNATDQNGHCFTPERSSSLSHQTTRLTNSNQPMQVDKKVWSTGYTMAYSSDNQPINGMPNTNPEVCHMTTPSSVNILFLCDRCPHICTYVKHFCHLLTGVSVCSVSLTRMKT